MQNYKKCPKCGRFHGLTDKNYCTTCGEYLRGVTLFDGVNAESPSDDEMSYSQSKWAYAVSKLFNRHKAVLIVALVALIVVPSVIGGVYNAQGNVYGRVIAALDKGDVARAYDVSLKLHDDYNDSLQLKKYCEARSYEQPINVSHGFLGSAYGRSADFSVAYSRYTELGAYKDSSERRLVCGYEYAVQVITNSANNTWQLEKAEGILYDISVYKDSAEKVEQVHGLLMAARMSEARRSVENAQNASDANESVRYYKDAVEKLRTVDYTVDGQQELFAQAQDGYDNASRRADEAKFDSLKQNLVGKWLDAEGNLAYTVSADFSVTTRNGLSGSFSVSDGELVMRYGMYTIYDEVPLWVVSMPSNDKLILTYRDNREELSRKPSAPQSGGLSAKDVEKNIVGTWVRSTPQGEEKLRFMKDGTYSATSVMSIVTEGTYYFEGGSLFIQTQTLLSKVESECTPSMDSKDSLWLTSKSGESENYTRKQ